MKTFVAINKIALPTLLFRISNVLNTFIGMFMIAQLGKLELAAGALIMSFSMMMLIAFGPIYALGVTLSRFAGEKAYDKISEFATQAVYFALMLACFVALLFCLAPYILTLFHQDQNLIPIVRSYLHMLILGLLPTFMIVLLVQLSSAVSTPKVMSFLGMAFVPVTALLGYGFIFGHFGFHDFGVSGYAIAITLSNWIMMIVALCYFKFSKAFVHIQLFKGRTRPCVSILKQMFMRGAPVSIQYGGELSASAVSNFFMGWFGIAALAAQQVVMQVFMVVNMLPFCVAQATSMLVGRSLGAKNIEQARLMFKVGLAYVVIICFIVSGLFIWGAPYFVRFYLPLSTPNFVQVDSIATHLFTISALLFTVMALSFYFTAVLRAFHDFAVPMKVGVLSYWIIGIPAAYLFAFIFHGGPVGIRLGLGLCVGVSATILGYRLFHKLFGATVMAPSLGVAK